MQKNKQIGGTHYLHQEFQHWDFATEVAHNDFYLKGCASKYVIRYKDKNGIEDLQKSLHYLEKIEEVAYYSPVENDRYQYIRIFIRQLDYSIKRIIVAIYFNRIERAKSLINNLIANCK